MLLQDPLLAYAGHTFRYASVGGAEFAENQPGSKSNQSIKRTYSDSAKEDPLKRFEYLRNGRATSVMIRATPNAVRWDEINRVQYRFQALNFHSDVLDALIQNSPPLSRREHNAATMTQASTTTASQPQQNKTTSKNDKNNNHRAMTRRRDGNNNNGSLSSSDEEEADDTTDGRHQLATMTTNFLDNKKQHRKNSNNGVGKVRTVRRMNSVDIRRERDAYDRKSSVVQVVGPPKDDTSDYNSDEEVFHHLTSGRATTTNDFLNTVNYNTTICHVKTGQIADTTQIHVSYENNNNRNKKFSMPALPLQAFTKRDLNTLADPNSYHRSDDHEQQRHSSSAPSSTKSSTAFNPISHAMATPLPAMDNSLSQLSVNKTTEDLSYKSKEDLIELVKSLQRELETTKQQRQSPTTTTTPTPPTNNESQQHSCSCSRQDSIEEEETDESAEIQQHNDNKEENLSPQNVSSLIENFERKNEDPSEFRLKRSSTLPYRIRKPPS